MKQLLLIGILLISSCTQLMENKNNRTLTTFTEKEILTQLDLAFDGEISQYYPAGRPQDIKYNFFLDLEHGYFLTAGSKIHLFSDSTRWAIVFEKSGYQNRSFSADIELDYIGNCINYPVDEYQERNYITNATNITLIDRSEFERIRNKQGSEMETFELIDPTIKEVKVRDTIIPFDNNYKNYEKMGIKVRAHENTKQLIGYGDLVRYLNETNSSIISATQEDIRKYIPKDLPWLMTINKFHFESVYDKGNPPHRQEIYQLLAKILVTRNTKNWQPTQKANNHWTNWESGNL
ncbi:hypothetical protein SAMN05661012_05144 [Chitinophaga sancti]|uniref:Lipoprotein n=1 Tax=Chitinophaga sancti TaxID=1004 RepID=A0A1K1SCK6_9BACT|nr:hypothetical protein SAMN05661012_05144 [Chitinophaga sancti]